MLNADKIRKDFPILSQKVNGKPLVYLDNAATSQKPAAVINELTRYYSKDNANIHRGVHTLAERATALYEGVRGKTAKFIGASSPKEIVFTRGTTEAINLVAYSWGKANLTPKDTVLLTVMEHHSNLVPWQLLSKELGFKLEFILVTEDGYLENPEETIRKVKPKLLGFVHVSNVLGTINLVKKLSKVAHKVGATVLIDGAQAVSHTLVNVQSLGADFYAFSAHKMLGPTGIGVLYGRRDLLESMPPFMGGGEMIREVSLDKSTYKDSPHKFEAGTPNIGGVAGFGAALDYISGVGMDGIKTHTGELTAYALDSLSKIDGLRIYGPRNPEDHGAVIAFTVEGIHPHDLATVLDGEGIAIRSGNHCTMPLHKHFDLVATARASFALYNTKEEVDKLAEAVLEAKKVLGA
ncbi:MAG TPA: cysteine desulfurase [candidate division WWE3 bacterium]|uniref:cysteine desulfurase n=1 Tax=candidate division WWE3 bacterium TaxID=2053526 RepID=A0A7C1SQE4_UNCKA|nr:cysteine desulfurase [candidate division WWE3 bacterium]